MSGYKRSKGKKFQNENKKKVSVTDEKEKKIDNWFRKTGRQHKREREREREREGERERE